MAGWLAHLYVLCKGGNKYKYNVGAVPQSVIGNLTWNPNGTLKQVAITDPLNSANSQTCNNTYDDLARVVGSNCGSVWSQTFSYDPFGNINKTGTNRGQTGRFPIFLSLSVVQPGIILDTGGWPTFTFFVKVGTTRSAVTAFLRSCEYAFCLQASTQAKMKIPAQAA